MKNLTLTTALFVLSATLVAEAGITGESNDADRVYTERVFSRYDDNHDRIVSEAEFKASRDGHKPSKKRVKFLMKHTDIDKDGFLSENEIRLSYSKRHWSRSNHENRSNKDNR
jgi:hypothetical protein